MKKITFLGSFLILIFAMGCNFSFTGSNLLTKPDVEAKDSFVSISIPRQSDDTVYINIYRKDVDDPDEKEINIGLLYPSAMDSIGSAYIFIDSLVYKNHTYTYMVRYSDKSDYYYSDWSNEITVSGGYEDSAILEYKENSAFFSINDVDYTLRISGSILSPDIKNFEDDYSPMLIITSGGKTQVFGIESLTDGSVIALRGYLPSDFLDKDVTIVGIVAQKTEFVPTDDPDAEPVVRRIYWTEPTDIKLKGYEEKTLFIPSANGSDGIDYSRKAGIQY